VNPTIRTIPVFATMAPLWLQFTDENDVDVVSAGATARKSDASVRSTVMLHATADAPGETISAMAAPPTGPLLR